MTPARWARIAPILQSALSRDEAARDAFVAEVCAGDDELRCEVESLLAVAPELRNFLSGQDASAFDLADDAGPEVGARIGPYEIAGRLGAGGMGEVYRARDTHLGRDVAIKILPQIFAADTARVARLEREARILATLNHPSIGAIYGLERADGLPSLILELIDGPTLAERLANGPLPIAEALSIGVAIAEALEAAHGRGIVHRDVKPGNIKLTPSGAVKLFDFGLAKDLEHHDELAPALSPVAAARGLSQPGLIMGTAAYMSPEQARGEAADSRTDLFSLGAVLYEMVSGCPAFAGSDGSGTLEARRSTAPTSARALDRSVPRSLDRIINRLLQPDPDVRYQTAADVGADLIDVTQELAVGPTVRARRRRLLIGAAAAIGLGAIVIWQVPLGYRDSLRGEYAQITNYPDAATSPALSPDGRLLTFVRGESTFEGPGQIYVKALPDGAPVQLTSDTAEKMSPVFSPDGARIAYTTISNQFQWDTWVVPAAGGTPRQWLANASGLAWTSDRRVLFSEMGHGLHMRLVSADESRDAEHAVYSPGSPEGMAHRSYPSPDGAWVLIAEMVRPVWQPCRLVSIDGRVTRRVGPDGQCTSAAWSPDGRWMYFSSNGSGSFHIWRQRFPDGAPEQISFAPGEEEGIAVARDGRSLFTSLGNRQSSIRVRDGSEEREVSHEGYAFVPAPPNSGVAQPFLAGGRLLYLVRHGPVVRFTGPGERAGELWETDPRTGRSEPLFPGVQVTGYDVSRDGSEIVFAALDDNGRSHVWLGRMDRTDPPREIVPVEADSPRFGAGGNIYYRSAAEGGPFIYRIDREGITQRAVARPVVFLLSVSPDGAWVVARVETSPGTDSSQSNIAFPTTGGKAPVRMCRMGCEVDWTPDGRGLVMRLGNDSGTSQSRTFVIALQPGESLPALPPEGIQSEADLVTVPVSASFDGTVYPSDVPSLVAYVRRATQRNIYRVPIP